MHKDHVTVWNGCLSSIQRHINPQAYKTWFEPVRSVRLEGNVLTIQVPNKFFYEWLEEHYVSIIKSSIKNELGDSGQLEYLIPKKDVDAKSPPKPSVANNPQRDKLPETFSAQEIKNPFVIPGIKKPKFETQLNEGYTFESFVEGDCNRFARGAAQAVSKKPGNTSFNPLFLFGATGLGKTHLAQAIGNELLRQGSDLQVLYVPSERFGTQFVDAMSNNAINDFLRFYQMMDVLIIDDIQFFSGKTKMQEVFFHIFNHLLQHKKQIIMTCDRPPRALDGMEERLISRFKVGLSCDLTPPDLETRMAIIQRKMDNEDIQLPYNVIEFIAYNIKSHVRELEGVLISITAQAALNNREIDIDLARDVIKHFVDNLSKEITIEYVHKMVAEHFNVPPEKMRDASRKREYVAARQVAMYLVKDMTGASLKAIGDYFGGRDHSTVIYSCKTVEEQITVDMQLREDVSAIERKIKMGTA